VLETVNPFTIKRSLEGDQPDEDTSQLVLAINFSLGLIAVILGYALWTILVSKGKGVYHEGEKFVQAERRMKRSTVKRITKEEFDAQAQDYTEKQLRELFRSEEY
jgi:hypothetical protein